MSIDMIPRPNGHVLYHGCATVSERYDVMVLDIFTKTGRLRKSI